MAMITLQDMLRDCSVPLHGGIITSAVTGRHQGLAAINEHLHADYGLGKVCWVVS